MHGALARTAFFATTVLTSCEARGGLQDAQPSWLADTQQTTRSLEGEQHGLVLSTGCRLLLRPILRYARLAATQQERHTAAASPPQSLLSAARTHHFMLPAVSLLLSLLGVQVTGGSALGIVSMLLQHPHLCHQHCAHHLMLPAAALPSLLGVQVTGGSALGIVSTGTDTLMSTTVQPSLAGGGYSGAALSGQQNGMNGAMNGPQPEQGNQQAPPKKSSTGVLSGPAGKLMACMAGVLGLLLPAML